MKMITIGIPAYKAQEHICDCLSSIQIQSIKDEVEVIIASDSPKDDYEFIKEKFDGLNIRILKCKKNGGAGIARQRCLDECKTDWITFIDADDVFFSPFALETLMNGIGQNIIEVQGVFMQEVEKNPQNIRFIPQDNVNHPWVFGRLYSVPFLRQNEIGFSELRAMEDGEFNWKIRMTIEGSPLKINILSDPIYLWKMGSEHSITRTGVTENGIAQYNFDLCQIGATIASIRAAKFCKERNPFNGGVDRFVTEMMVDKYFTYVECLSKRKIFAEQNFFNAKRFYHESYKEIENRISDKILSDIYTVQRSEHGEEMIGIIPEISFYEFMERVKDEEYGGEKELKHIRSKLPKNIIDSDIATGVATF